MKPRLTRLSLLFLCVELAMQQSTVLAQQTSFTAPDTVCVNVPVSFHNTSTGASSNYWTFCVADINAVPVATNLGNIGGTLAAPAFMDYAEYNGIYYGYVVNNYPGGLVQLNFGNSLLNTPTATYMGNFGGAIPNSEEGIQLVQEGGQWYGILVGGTPLSGGVSSITTISFGTDLGNTTPTATNWGNAGGLSYPTSINLVQEGGQWYGFTLNSTDNTITRFSFGSSIANPPTGVNLGSLGNVVFPTGIYLAQSNGNWSLFEVSQSNNTLARLDFGSSILNTPTAVNLGNPGNALNLPRDLTLIQYCGNTVGFAVNWQTSDLIRLNFPGGLTSVPTGVSLGDIGGMSAPQSISKIFQEGSDLFVFVTNILNNSITLVEFNGCDNSTIPPSSAVTPSPVTYTTPGIYNVSLQTNVGLPSQSAFCKTVVVLPTPTITLPADTSLCSGDTLTLMAPLYPGAIYAWNNGSSVDSTTVSASAKIWLDLNSYGCKVSDTVLCTEIAQPSISLPKDTTFCDSGAIRFVSPQPVTYTWNTGSIADSTKVRASGLYWLQLNGMGCTAIDTVQATVLSTHQVYLGKDTSFCGPGILRYPDTALVTYLWNTGSDSSSTLAPSTGPYWLALTQLGCTSRDTINLTVIAQPVVDLPKDTLLCDSGILRFVSLIPVTYHWTTGSDSSSTFINASGLYKLTVDNAGCEAADSTQVTVVPTPALYLPTDTAFCGPGLLSYVSGLPVTYTWSDGSSASSTTVSAGGLYWLQLNNQGCIIRDSTQCVVNPLPSVNLGNDTAVCLVHSYTLNAGNNPGGYTYQWQDGSSLPTYVVTQPGLFSVAVSLNSCIASDSILISAIAIPHFTLGADQPICPGEAIYLKPSTDTLTYLWQDGSSDSLYKVVQPGIYYVTGSNVCGSYEDSVMIYKGICVVHVPSAFTPNGDGTNDLFKVLGIEVVDHFVLSIYNRYGQKVFETTDKTQGWDGTFHGNLQPIGTYVYQLGFRYSITGQSYRMDGTVMLIR